MAFGGILSQIKLLFWPPVIQLVWYILLLFTTKLDNLALCQSNVKQETFWNVLIFYSLATCICNVSKITMQVYDT